MKRPAFNFFNLKKNCKTLADRNQYAALEQMAKGDQFRDKFVTKQKTNEISK